MFGFKELLQKSLEKKIPELNTQWQNSAKKAGWDESLIGNVSVGPNLKFKYPENLSEKVLNSEYGLGTGQPKPAMREFSYNSKPEVEGAVYEALSKYLTDGKVI